MSRRWPGSSVGRYMMMPTQETRSSWETTVLARSSPFFDDAGESFAEEAAVHRCSMGAGAGMPSASITPRRSRRYWTSRPEGSERRPAGKAHSLTHCWPPHSKFSFFDESATSTPCDRRQNSASAALTRLTCDTSRGSIFRSSSLSWAKFNEDTSSSSVRQVARRERRGSSLSSIEYLGGSPWPSPRTPSKVGLFVTTTTASTKGIHMNLAWRLFRKMSAHWLSASARVKTATRSRSKCFGTHRKVASRQTPMVPRETLIKSNMGCPLRTSMTP
mmetsp:Transcript_10578/g.34952  ORF Transcript_10578/g.34952 Transcript_10578/m.34952 type:complete len:274 (+) Transcript_10578:510-1331(+)